MAKSNLPVFRLFTLFFSLGLFASMAYADEGGIFRLEAEWKASSQSLIIKSKGRVQDDDQNNTSADIINADTNQLIFSESLELEDDGKWELEAKQSLSGPPPCKVRILVENNSRSSRTIKNAPANCDDGSTGGAPPVANAGNDQTLTLAANQTNINVQLNGNISSDADGTIEQYNWTGTPNPDNVAAPIVNLAAGQYSFNLQVTDNDGLTSNTDSVSISVVEASSNQPPFANAGADKTLTLAVNQTSINLQLDGTLSEDTDGSIQQYIWNGVPNPDDIATPSVNLGVGQFSFSLQVIDNEGLSSAIDSVTVNVITGQIGDLPSINSTSVNSFSQSPAVSIPVLVNNGDYALLAANDLGMHCADLDYQIFSILPPFNVVHAQVVKKGSGNTDPKLMDDTDIELSYSAASNANDPALATASQTPVFKSNFWQDDDNDGKTVGFDAYSPLFFGLLQPGDIAANDTGLPVPESALLRECLNDYLNGIEGPEGPRAKCGFQQQSMPGKNNPYIENAPANFARYDREVNFFNELLGPLGLGSIIHEANWWSADGIPVLPVDDAGRDNAYPLMRMQAKDKTTGAILASTDIVLPVASEANCQNCHAAELDCATTTQETGDLFNCTEEAIDRTTFNVMTLNGDDNDELPPGDTLLQRLLNAAKINVLRLHDKKHNTQLDASRPIQCSTCHYSPALDLAQLGPTDSAGTEQTSHISMTRAMHGHHGDLKNRDGNDLFPAMPEPIGRPRLAANDVLEKTCYQCHPGTKTQCLRGAMTAGGVVCQDCHGDMQHVGNDFSENLASTPWPAGANLSKRIPWASEPQCQSCHTGDAVNNLASQFPSIVATDGIRLLKSFTVTNGKDNNGNNDGTEIAAPIHASNNRFAENESLYRLSKGHGGLMCEACHGSTHAIFPNPNPNANDNVTSVQLQGHRGTITECSTCHKPGSLDLTLDGPHGMHPVNDRNWNKEHEELAENNPSVCKTCHGVNGEGTVLSKTATQRQLLCKNKKGSLCDQEEETITVAKGTKIGCQQCHENLIHGEQEEDSEKEEED